MKNILLVFLSIIISLFVGEIGSQVNAADLTGYGDINADSNYDEAGDAPAVYKIDGKTVLNAQDDGIFCDHDDNSIADKYLAQNSLFIGFNAGKYLPSVLPSSTCGSNEFGTYRSAGNAFIGYQAGEANNGIHTTIVGTAAGSGCSYDGGEDNPSTCPETPVLTRASVFIGWKAGAEIKNPDGRDGLKQNTIIGAMAGAMGRSNDYVTIIGAEAGLVNEGMYNIFIGSESGKFNTSGENNILIGQNAGAGHYTDKCGFLDCSLNTGDNNLHIGFQTEVTAPDLSSTILLGSYAQAEESHQMVVGSYLPGETGTSGDEGLIKSSYWGSGVRSTSPQDFSINASGGKRTEVFSTYGTPAINYFSGYTGNHVQGADLILAGGRGTGSANGGKIIFKTAKAGKGPCIGESLVPGSVHPSVPGSGVIEERNCPEERMVIDSNGSVTITPTKTDTNYLAGVNLTTTDSYSGSSDSGSARALNVVVDHSGTPTGYNAGPHGANYQVRFLGSGTVDLSLAQQNQLVFRSNNNYTVNNLWGNLVQLSAAGPYNGTHTVNNYYGYYSYGAAISSQTLNGTNWRHAYFTDFPDFGGTVSEVTGLWIDKQTLGTNNYGIVLAGDGAGADIAFGPNQETRIYSNNGHLYAQDSSGYDTLLSPHDPETGEWIFYSKNTKTGRTVRVNMEELVRDMEKLTGKKYLIESFIDEK